MYAYMHIYVCVHIAMGYMHPHIHIDICNVYIYTYTQIYVYIYKYTFCLHCVTHICSICMGCNKQSRDDKKYSYLFISISIYRRICSLIYFICFIRIYFKYIKLWKETITFIHYIIDIIIIGNINHFRCIKL